MDDNDELLHFYDIQGESLYTNPPDPNYPLIDHGLDEDKVWAFKMTGYNQSAVSNIYKSDVYAASRMNHIPWWAAKLTTPAFYKNEKFQKMMQQWDWRKGLEAIKMKHALIHNNYDRNLRDSQKAEIQSYLGWVRDQQQKEFLKDVYITDNKPQTPKYNVNNQKELDTFYRYQKSLEQYNSDIEGTQQTTKKGKYELGSLAQRIFEPMQQAETDENGMRFIKVQDAEIRRVDEETMRKMYDNALERNLEPMSDDVESDEFRIQLMEDLEADNVSLEKWNEIMCNELGVFKGGEKYDYVTDIRRQFDPSLATSKIDKIFETIPEHVFWDIKKPLDRHQEEVLRENQYNPTRQHYANDFFDLRATEEWRRNRDTKRDLN